MSTRISPLAGQPVPKALLIDVDKLVAAYYSERPDPGVPAQRVSLGTSGHRGSAFDVSFNEWHVLAITQALCDHRKARGIAGPLFLGLDTHALSAPACASALEVLAANGVEVMLATNDEPTPTPAVSHAILIYLVLAGQLGSPVEGRIQAPATAEQKARLAARSPKQIDAGELAGELAGERVDELAGEEIVGVLSQAPRNGAPIGGIKVSAKSGRCAARPSGTEDIYQIYAEGFQGAEHPRRILLVAQATVDAALAPKSSGMRP